MSINNSDVHVTTTVASATTTPPTITETCVASTCYKNFVASVKPADMEIKSLTVRDSVLKGRFNWLEGEVLNKMSGKVNKTFMLLRGDAVAILVLIVNKSQNYILVTEQLRAPTGGIRHEAVAGMMDDDGMASGVAIKEMDEETGIVVKPDELFEIGSYYSSQGIMDEKIRCFFMRRDMTDAQLTDLTSKLHVKGDFEAIRLRLIPATWAEIIKTQDAKLISCYAMYQDFIAKNDAKSQEQSNMEILVSASTASAKGEDFGDALLKGMFADLTKRGRPLTYSEMREMYG
jgi:ADP-sugar diphosphatase